MFVGSVHNFGRSDRPDIVKKNISIASLHKKSWTDSNEQAHRFKGQT